MTKQEGFITKTLLPYFTGEEAFSMDDNGYCVYNGPNGTHCAIAKCVKNPESLEEGVAASKQVEKKGFSILTDEALEMGFTAKEWDIVQSIHDRQGVGLRLRLIELSKYGPFTKLREEIAAYRETKK
jgi:hypothetical protein